MKTSNAARSPEQRSARPARAKAPPEPRWRRPEGDQSVSQELGVRLRAAREAKGLSLAQLSELSGIPGATISRIENNKMSPTFGVLARLMTGLRIDWGDLVESRRLAPSERLISFAEPGDGRSSVVRGSRASVLHPHDAARSLPLLVEVHDRDLADVGGLSGHRGEEFCYVLSGTLVLHVEGRPPRIMQAGASALFDSETPHAYLSGSKGGVRILIVVVRGHGGREPEPATAPKF